jgi:NADPH-dependent 2,4-dienoyl-CoA reductase/sulfur reductase-like enzyme/peroxiredoxin family protein/TusA-related sulfurtransferase/rhodanese-related sulfurtransferase
MSRKILIVGGVAGGATAAARLRRINKDYEIIMFEKDEYIAFANCGLPYYIGDTITDRSKLLVQTVEGLSAQYNLDIRNNSLVESIDRENKTVTVTNLKTNESYTESYDDLILSPGATPIVPSFPSLSDANNVFTLRNIPDTDQIKAHTDSGVVKKAVVVGGGFIGVEMAENLAELGIDVTLIDNGDHILRPFDIEMASFLEAELKDHGIKLALGAQVTDVSQTNVTLADGTVYDTDMTILAIGVAPSSKLAVDAGLEVNGRKQIVVNDKLQTSDASIYAIGDVIETNSIIDNRRINIPLAWPANRQGRLVADIISGSEVKYTGVMGTSVLKVCNLTGAATGFSSEFLAMNEIEHESIHVHKVSHASYYPGASLLSIKLTFDPKTGRIYGAQAVGLNGVEKRIDVLATAIKANMTVWDLQDVEVCYAPPYNSAKDPMNIAGYVASNVADGDVKVAHFNQVDQMMKDGYKVIDVRTAAEFELNHIEGSINIPLNEFDESSITDKTIITCQVGLRGYVAYQKINHLNLENVYNLSGGFYTYNTFKKNQQMTATKIENKVVTNGDTKKSSDHVLDARGLQCPGPIMQTNAKIGELNDGEELTILVSDKGFCQDIESWCNIHGNELISLNRQPDATYVVVVKKGASTCKLIKPKTTENKGTIVMFSGDMDKALGAMIIAQGAQAMGKEMTIFFTFWGLNMLRRDEKVKVEKTMFEKMFGFMMPRGAKRSKISNMNMFGMGTKMIKGRMKDKQVKSLEEMILDAQSVGVKMVACTMSMELMGIQEEELIDGLEFAGVAAYVGDSTGADLTLFI